MKRMKTGTVLLLTLLSAIAQAHVTVWPRESKAGAHEKYVVRVPTETPVPTASVELQIPAGLRVISLGAPNGFTYEVKKENERITSIRWIQKIGPREFAEFSFLAVNPRDATELVWKAVQHLADGSTVEWTGSVDAKRPASVTKLTSQSQ